MEKKKDNDMIPDITETSVSSMGDCTGLIPVAPVNQDQTESYEQLYPYRPPVIHKKK